MASFHISPAFAWVLTSAIALSTLSAASAADKVKLNNRSGHQNGILIDGRDSKGEVDDRTKTFSGATKSAGQLDNSTVSNEVIAFTMDRPMAIQAPVSWTGANATATVTFQAPILIPVKVWIVKGPFADQRSQFEAAAEYAGLIWKNERVGIAISTPYDVVDATADPDAPGFHSFTCTKRTNLQTQIGHDASKINIYYVDTVNGGTGLGDACVQGGNFIALGSSTADDLLIHEIGHNFNLRHVNNKPGFNKENIMDSREGPRSFITEGQTFRAHIEFSSAINQVYNARPSQPRRLCPEQPGTLDVRCPLLEKRIWADGVLRKN